MPARRPPRAARGGARARGTPPAPTLDRSRCDACGRCEPACPYGALRVVGRDVAVEDLADEVARDRPFFEASGGGATLSGGEPTSQLEAMAALARALRARGIPAGLQTCGAFRWEAFAPHVGLFDFIHFDVKLADEDEHRRLTGAGNAAIVENARRLVAAGAPVRFRLPVVPGLTDTAANLAGVAALLRDLGAARLHLLGYHAMGEAKLARVGSPRPPFEAPGEPPLEARVARAAATLRAAGLEVVT